MKKATATTSHQVTSQTTNQLRNGSWITNLHTSTYIYIYIYITKLRIISLIYNMHIYTHIHTQLNAIACVCKKKELQIYIYMDISKCTFIGMLGLVKIGVLLSLRKVCVIVCVRLCVLLMMWMRSWCTCCCLGLLSLVRMVVGRWLGMWNVRGFQWSSARFGFIHVYR